MVPIATMVKNSDQNGQVSRAVGAEPATVDLPLSIA
jgi:hypothetical protein